MKRFATFIGANADGVKRLITGAIAFVTGLAVIEALGGVMTRLLLPGGRFLTAQFDDAPEAGEGRAQADGDTGYLRKHLGQLLIAAIALMVTAVLLAFDSQFVGLTLPGLGVTPTAAAVTDDNEYDQSGQEPAPSSAARQAEALTELTTYVFIAITIIWGIAFLEAFGLTHLAPAPAPRVRLPLQIASVLCLGGCLVLTIAMGLWRADLMAVADAREPAPASATSAGAALRMTASTDDSFGTASDDAPHRSRSAWVAPTVNWLLPALALITTVLTMTGVLVFVRYMVALAVVVALVIPAIVALFLVPAFRNTVNTLVNSAHQVVDLVAAAGDAPPAPAPVRAPVPDEPVVVRTTPPAASPEQNTTGDRGPSVGPDLNWGFDSRKA